LIDWLIYLSTSGVINSFCVVIVEMFRVFYLACALIMSGCSRTDFGHQLEHFDKERFTLVAWDPRGYGKSIPPTRDWPEKFFQRDAEDAAMLMEVFWWLFSSFCLFSIKKKMMMLLDVSVQLCHASSNCIFIGSMSFFMFPIRFFGCFP